MTVFVRAPSTRKKLKEKKKMERFPIYDKQQIAFEVRSAHLCLPFVVQMRLIRQGASPMRPIGQRFASRGIVLFRAAA